MRNLLIFSMLCAALSCNAQIFNHKRVLDKFDDAIFDGPQKTLIQKNDTAFIIEEKGRKPVVYIIENMAEYACAGDKDNIVNLVKDVYGYEECWSVVLESDYASYRMDKFELMIESDEEKIRALATKLVNKYTHYITHRVVTTQYTHQFLNEYYWVQKGDNNGRTVYSNQY